MLTTRDAKEHIDNGRPYEPVSRQELASLMTGGIIGSGRSTDSRKAISLAYQDAVNNLRRIGLIRANELGEHYRTEQDFDRSYESQFRAAYNKAKSQGYSNIFSTDTRLRLDRSGNTAYLNLIGIKVVGGRVVKDIIYILALPANLVISKGKLLRDKSQLRRMLYEAYARDESRRRAGTSQVEDLADESEEEEEDVGD
jgi:hypothetical protein